MHTAQLKDYSEENLHSRYSKFHVYKKICLWISIIRTNFTIVHNWNNGIQYIVGLVSLSNYQAEGLFVRNFLPQLILNSI